MGIQFDQASMASPSLVVLVVTLVLSSFSLAAALHISEYNCDYSEDFGTNSTYRSNLRSLLDILSSNATQNAVGFFNVTTGEDPDKVYGYFICRGDVSTEDCATCVRKIAGLALDVQDCSTAKEVVFWESKCSVRYSELNFFSQTANSPDYYSYMFNNVTDQESFRRQVTAPLQRAVAKAANSTKKYGTIKVEIANGNTVHSLLQCTQDLSSYQCGDCLRAAVAQMLNSWGGSSAAALFYPTCSVHYEMVEFYRYDAAADVDASAPTKFPPPPPPPPPPNSPSTGESQKLLVAVIAIVSSVAASVILLLTGLLTLLRRKVKAIKNKRGREEGNWSQAAALDSLQYNLVVLRAATNNFSIENMLGRGGFGEVYKGQLPNAGEVAVKKLSRSSIQGAEQFKNEVQLLARLQHRNLVRLLGYCMEEDENILIYEYVPNQSLDHFLFNPKKQAQLDWSKRYNLIAGIARGMLYLHEDSRLRVIHRDLKASNILLDQDMNPKICDFGIAKIADQTQGCTSRIVGTLGYIPPEYMMRGNYSVKSDIYSFGVLILEIISGKENNNVPETLTSYAWRHWTKGDPLKILDPVVRDCYSQEEVTRCIHIGLLCVQDDPSDRPTMAAIVLMLNTSSTALPSPKQLAFFTPDRATPTIPINMDGPKQYANLSVNISSITDLYPR